VQLEVAEHGKPFVRGTRLRFNLSHAGSLALVALAEDLEVGVDVERPGRNAAAVERSLSAGERASGDDWLQLWCRKEAWAKATGGGLGWAPEAFDTTRVTGYALTDLALGDGYVGALAVEGEDAAHTLCRLTF
jgi:4'-phosphopantetheinyl transferase